MSELDYELITNVSLGGMDYRDAPDFCDAYIESADYCGEEMTEDQLETLNADRDYVYERIIDFIY